MQEYKYEIEPELLELGDEVKLILDPNDAYYEEYNGEFIGKVTKEISCDSGWEVGNIYFLQKETRIFHTQQKSKSYKLLYLSEITLDTLSTITGHRLPCGKVKVISKTLGTTKERPIEHDETGFHLKDSKQPIKITKILSVIYPELTSLELEEYSNKYKELYTIDTSKVLVSSDICSVYNISEVGGSCMALKGEFMNLYEELGCKIAYLLNEDGDLRARALLWDNNIIDEEGIPYRIMDRVFYSKEVDKLTLYTWYKENGYTRFSKNKDKTFTTTEAIGPQDYVPYVDNMRYVLNVGNNSYQLTNDASSDFVDCLEETKGSSSENSGISRLTKGVWCADIEDYKDEDDVFFCETDREYYAYSDDLVYIEGYGWYREDDVDICFVEDTEEYGFKGNYYETIDGLFYSSTDELIWCFDIDNYVHEDDNYVYVEDFEEYYYHTDELYRDPEGYWWSDEDAYLEARGLK